MSSRSRAVSSFLGFLEGVEVVMLMEGFGQWWC